jgi:hypothetical protein
LSRWEYLRRINGKQFKQHQVRRLLVYRKTREEVVYVEGGGLCLMYRKPYN